MHHEDQSIRRARRELKQAERALERAVPGTAGHAVARERRDAAALRYIALTALRTPSPVADLAPARAGSPAAS